MRALLIGYLIFIILIALVVIYIVSRLRVKFPGRFIFIILLVIISPVIISYLSLSYFYPLPETAVPDLNGLSEAQAQQKLEEIGLTMHVEKKYDEGDLVTFQRPEPGRTVKEGRSVTVIIGNPRTIDYLNLTTPEGQSTPPPQNPANTSETTNEGENQP